MAIDFTLSPELEAIRDRVRGFIDEVVKPGEARINRIIDRSIQVHGALGYSTDTRLAHTGDLPV